MMYLGTLCCLSALFILVGHYDMSIVQLLNRSTKCVESCKRFLRRNAKDNSWGNVFIVYSKGHAYTSEVKINEQTFIIVTQEISQYIVKLLYYKLFCISHL